MPNLNKIRGRGGTNSHGGRGGIPGAPGGGGRAGGQPGGGVGNSGLQRPSNYGLSSRHHGSDPRLQQQGAGGASRIGGSRGVYGGRPSYAGQPQQPVRGVTAGSGDSNEVCRDGLVYLRKQSHSLVFF